MSTYSKTGSILNMTPARGQVCFGDTADNLWSLPLIGWAVVVTYSEAEESEVALSEYMWAQTTELQPVVLHGKRARALSAYLDERSGSGARARGLYMDGAVN